MSELKKCPSCGFFPFDENVETCPLCGSEMKTIAHDGDTSRSAHHLEAAIPEDSPTLKVEEPHTPATVKLPEERSEISEDYDDFTPPQNEQAPPKKEPDSKELPSTRVHSGASRIERSRRFRHYASLSERALAFAFDMALLTVLSLAGTAVAFYISYTYAGVESLSFYLPDSRALEAGKVAFPFLFFVLSFFYFTVFHGLCGQTPGKMLLEIMVVDEFGEPPGLEKAAFRYFCYIISAVPALFGFFISAISSKSQALHDKLTGTEVIRV